MLLQTGGAKQEERIMGPDCCDVLGSTLVVCHAVIGIICHLVDKCELPALLMTPTSCPREINETTCTLLLERYCRSLVDAVLMSYNG